MVLLPLLLAAGLLSATAEMPRRRRVQELRGRLGLGEAPRARSDLATRVAWLEKTYGWFDQTLRGLAFHLHEKREGLEWEDSIPPGVHDPALEAYLVWMGAVLERGLPVSAVRWESAGLRGTNRGDRGFSVERPSGVSRDVESTFRIYLANPSYPNGLELARVLLSMAGSDQNVSYAVAFNRDEGTLDDHPVVFLNRDDRMPSMTMVVQHVDRSVYRVYLDEALLSDAMRLIDWIEATHPNLSRFSYLDAIAASDAWHQTFIQTERVGDPVQIQPQDEVLYRWPDGSTLVSLRSGRSLRDEGLSMGHCVGGYWAKVREGKSVIWSYRGARGAPVLTVEMEPTTGLLFQIHGQEDIAVSEMTRPEEFQALYRTAWRWARTFSMRHPGKYVLEALDALGVVLPLYDVDLDVFDNILSNAELLSSLRTWAQVFSQQVQESPGTQLRLIVERQDLGLGIKQDGGNKGAPEIPLGPLRTLARHHGRVRFQVYDPEFHGSTPPPGAPPWVSVRFLARTTDICLGFFLDGSGEWATGWQVKLATPELESPLFPLDQAPEGIHAFLASLLFDPADPASIDAFFARTAAMLQTHDGQMHVAWP